MVKSLTYIFGEVPERKTWQQDQATLTLSLLTTSTSKKVLPQVPGLSFSHDIPIKPCFSEQTASINERFRKRLAPNIN